jgi:glycosyltransferase involved in cell wall biosynthesis
LRTSCIAILGRKDEPTDAVEEYCRYLADALQFHDIDLEIRRVPWELDGWPKALGAFKLMANKSRDSWALVQYTALAWSARGFPQRVLQIMRILKSAGARVGIVFHDAEPYPGTRLIDSVRRLVQVNVMRRALVLADLAIFTVPPDRLSWPPSQLPRAVFIPVGPNLPILSESTIPPTQSQLPTIGVFSITGGAPGEHETRILCAAVRCAAQQLGELRLLVFGRHAELRDRTLRSELRGLPVELSVEGVLDPDQVVQRLSASHVLLFVRGHISSRRSSAIAGIACGLPVIAFGGLETAPPITDAGVVLVSPERQDQLNEALVRVLSDPALRSNLAARSRIAYQTNFSWSAISKRFAGVLRRNPENN